MRGTQRRSRAGAGLLLACLALIAVAPLAAVAAQTAPETKVDINRAGAEELTALPGIGETMARRIVDFRKEHGPFERVEDLLKVKGIGEKSFQKLRPHVTVSRNS